MYYSSEVFTTFNIESFNSSSQFSNPDLIGTHSKQNAPPPLRVLIVDNYSEQLDHLHQLLAGHSLEVVTAAHVSSEKASEKDLIILSGGGKYSVAKYANTVYRKEIDLVKNETVDVPILGICLGLQIIAYAYGSLLIPLPKKRKETITITMEQNEPISGNRTEAKVYECHRWAVGLTGNELEILATSEDGVEIVRHSQRLTYGVQFHPETTAKSADGKIIFDNFLQMIPRRAI